MTNQATLEVLKYQLNRAKGRYDLHRTVMLQDRINRLKEAINFIEEGQ